MNPFSSLKVGSVELPNRLIMAPVKTGYGTLNGEVTYRHEAYYRRRAVGGVGAIIVEPLYIDPVGKEHPKQLGISSYHQVEGLRSLVDAIHDGGTLAIAHINHAGRAANPKASGKQPEAPSEVICPMSGVTPRSMTSERIKQVILEFAGAARRAIEAGFDIIEVQFGLGYLISQFLCTRTNSRTDEYGGSEKNRYHFAREVLKSIFQEIGTGTPVIARISATERVPGGLDIDDARALARLLQNHGVAGLHVASGSICDTPPWYYQHMRLPVGKNLEWAGAIKEEVDLPVIAVGRLGNPSDIRVALNDGLADIVALGRPLVADPDLPRKMKEDRDEDVIQCGACLQGCLVRVKSGDGLGCIVNPEVGRESVRIHRTEKPKTVVVVGGGPGGMQAALTAEQQNHRVILFDEHDLGGQFNLSFIPPGKEMMKRPLSSLVNKVKKSTIDLRLSRKASSSDIAAEKPDAVILATGATPIVPSITGMANVLTGEDVLTGKKGVGREVLIIGGGSVGLETAEFLSARGHSVTIVELLEDVARDMAPMTRSLTVAALKQAGTRIITEATVTRFEGRTAFARIGTNEEPLGDFDSVIVTVGTQSINELEIPIRKMGINVRVIGDAKKPRQIYDAVDDGFKVALDI